MIDAGFLDLVRLGVLPASDPVVQSSLTVVDDTIERDNAERPGLLPLRDQPGASRRTATATATSRAARAARRSGAPWPPTDTGTGHLWPVLSGERGEYDIAAGDSSGAAHAADRDAEHDLGPGARARAGVGGPGPPALAVRHRPDDRVDRLRRRSAGRLGQPADLGPGVSTRGWRSTSAPGATSRRRRSSPTATSRTGCPARCR